ncbi:hypothetical protein CUMW_060320 [Citrus unshiu]|uniref:Fe2OG dioxygenase domain-containing protein n=2 Tax=Citrus TaxID=2706 RepID=A0A2H5NMX9_CITUN|nr:hypothetical protein CUMW_060320 [Citrus unshiu]
MFCVKGLSESGRLTSVPSKYFFEKDLNDDCINSEAETIPIIDFSMLTSGSPEQRYKTIQAIGNACLKWGFFEVINHGVPNTLRDEMIRASESFFDLSDEQKREYAGKKLFDPIRWGTSFNVNVDKTLFWRDYLKIHVHPQFNAPQNPLGFSETIQEYCKRVRELANELLKGIMESLGLEESYIQKAMDLETDSHQLLVVNLYPPCPQPEVVMGLPPHSDHGLLTILMQNDHILSNGKYKSVLHRAVVNGKATRISVATAHGPPLDTVVGPAQDLLDNENRPPLYRGIKYREYLQLQQSNQLKGKSCLDHVKVNINDTFTMERRCRNYLINGLNMYCNSATGTHLRSTPSMARDIGSFKETFRVPNERDATVGVIDPRAHKDRASFQNITDTIGFSYQFLPEQKNVTWTIVRKVRSVTREQVRLLRVTVHDESNT